MNVSPGAADMRISRHRTVEVVIFAGQHGAPLGDFGDLFRDLGAARDDEFVMYPGRDLEIRVPAQAGVVQRLIGQHDPSLADNCTGGLNDRVDPRVPFAAKDGATIEAGQGIIWHRIEPLEQFSEPGDAGDQRIFGDLAQLRQCRIIILARIHDGAGFSVATSEYCDEEQTFRCRPRAGAGVQLIDRVQVSAACD